MDPLDQLDGHRYLYLTGISEPEDNALRLRIEEGRVPEVEEGSDGMIGRPIVADARSAAYQVLFPDYVAYAVVNESFDRPSESDEAFTGRLVRRYTRSRFLDFIAAGTSASASYPGRFTHYEFCCLNHLVSVAAVSPPQVTRLKPSSGGARGA